MLHLPCQCPSTGQPHKPFENRTLLCSSVLIVYATPPTNVSVLVLHYLLLKATITARRRRSRRWRLCCLCCFDTDKHQGADQADLYLHPPIQTMGLLAGLSRCYACASGEDLHMAQPAPPRKGT